LSNIFPLPVEEFQGSALPKLDSTALGNGQNNAMSGQVYCLRKSISFRHCPFCYCGNARLRKVKPEIALSMPFP
jgi:hypothetical protein